MLIRGKAQKVVNEHLQKVCVFLRNVLECLAVLGADNRRPLSRALS